MKVSTKLAAGFAVLLVIAIAVGAVGFTGMRGSQASGLYMYEKRVRSLEYVHEAVVGFNKMRIDAHKVLIDSFFDDKKGAIDSYQNFKRNAGKFLFWMEKSREIAEAGELLGFHDRILELFENSYFPKARANCERSINDVPDHHNKLYINVQIAALAGVTERIQSLLTGLVALNTALANQANIDNRRLTQRYMFMQVTLLNVAVISMAVVAFFIIGSIAGPINESAEVLEEIARGNFEARVQGDYQGDFKTIKDSVNDTAARLSLYLDEKMRAERSAHESDLAKARAEAATEAVLASINYAGRIQRNILPPDGLLKKTFSDCSVTWEPRYIVGGDIYWLKNFEAGAVLCVCDCTGHGTSGALLTMLVVSTLEAVVGPDNCRDPADIIWRLEQRLVSVFSVNPDGCGPDDIQSGCDLAVLFIAKGGGVSLSSGNTNVFVCDGREVRQIKGQKIYVGEGRLKGKADVKTVHIPANPGHKFYIASDGLFEQPGGERSEPYGYKEFKRIILENHHETQAVVSGKIWEAFEKHRGAEPRVDDFELIAFKP